MQFKSHLQPVEKKVEGGCSPRESFAKFTRIVNFTIKAGSLKYNQRVAGKGPYPFSPRPIMTFDPPLRALLERLQFAEDSGNQFRHCRMNMHGPLHHCVRGTRIHHVQDTVDRLIAAGAENGCSQDLF
jgi:hypothetical protein